MVFFLSRLPEADVQAFLAWADQKLADRPVHVVAVLDPVVRGLGDLVLGARFDADGRTESGRRLLGWTTGRHWVLEAAGIGRRAA